MNKRIEAGGLEKLSTGIAGFDHLTAGGLPAHRTTLLIGGPGSGKTVFALQTLVNGARRGEPGIFVSFSENPRQVVENAEGFGWDLPKLEQDKLTFLDARLRTPGAGADRFDLDGMLPGLSAVAAESGARHIVFDSIDLLFAFLDDRPAELQEVFRLRDWLYENGFTALLTANLEGADPRTSQSFASVQSVADCVVSLGYRLTDRAALRDVRVVKYRGSRFTEQDFPFVIGENGIDVLLPRTPAAAGPGAAAGVGPEIEQARNELTARIQALDQFLEMKKAELEFLARKESPPAGRLELNPSRAPSKSSGLAQAIQPER